MGFQIRVLQVFSVSLWLDIYFPNNVLRVANIFNFEEAVNIKFGFYRPYFWRGM